MTPFRTVKKLPLGIVADFWFKGMARGVHFSLFQFRVGTHPRMEEWRRYVVFCGIEAEFCNFGFCLGRRIYEL